jgi:hypothetical protein
MNMIVGKMIRMQEEGKGVLSMTLNYLQEGTDFDSVMSCYVSEEDIQKLLAGQRAVIDVTARQHTEV